MKKITESELKNKVLGLKEKMAELENRQLSEVNWGAIGTGAMNAVKGAGTAIGNALSTTGGKIAGGAALGAGALAAGQQLTKPTGATTGAKSDPAILKQQQDLIAKGAKIKADGIMGPATQAAIKQFGGQAAAPAAAPTGTTAPAAPAGDAAKNPVGTTNASTAIPTGGLENPANQATPAAAPAAAPVSGAPANVTAQGSEFGTDATFAKPAAAPAPMKGGYGSGANNPSLATAAPAAAPVDTTDPLAANNAQSVGAAPTATAGTPPPPAVKAESVSFRNDELSRILTLIHHR